MQAQHKCIAYTGCPTRILLWKYGNTREQFFAEKFDSLRAKHAVAAYEKSIAVQTRHSGFASAYYLRNQAQGYDSM
jgi:hypothetical protein